MNLITEFKIGEESYLAVVVPKEAYGFRFKEMPDRIKQFAFLINGDNGNTGTCCYNGVPKGQYSIIGEILRYEGKAMMSFNTLTQAMNVNPNEIIKAVESAGVYMVNPIKEPSHFSYRKNAMEYPELYDQYIENKSKWQSYESKVLPENSKIVVLKQI